MHKLTILLTLLASSLSPLAADDIDSLLASYSQAISQHRHFAAEFTQARHISMFPEPLVSQGTITFAHPNRIKLHYSTPFEAVIVLRDGDMKRYRVQDNMYVEQPSLEIVTKAITSEMARWFSADFTTDFPYTVSTIDNDPRRLHLVPESAAARLLFDAIELTFPPVPDYIQKVKLIETSGDSLVITHTRPSFAPVDASAFDIGSSK